MDELIINYPYRDKKQFFSAVAPFIYVAAIVLGIFAALGRDGALLVLPAFLLLYFICKWFATDTYPPVLLFAFLYQWMQVCIKPIYAAITFDSLENLAEFPQYIHEAYYLSLLAIFILALGIYMMIRRISYAPVFIEEHLKLLNTRKTLIAYLVFSFLATLVYGLRFAIPGLFQGVVALGYIKWALFFFAFYTAYKKKENRQLLNIIILFEFIAGFASYFADFKTIAFMVAIAYLSVSRIKQMQLVYLGLGLGILGYIGVLWTAVKFDYREYLNQDSGQQVVRVDDSEALQYLANNVTNISDDTFSNALIGMVNRISYIDYFSSCMAYVPEVIPHEDGALTKQSIMHILVPRLFNPDKAPIDDSVHLSKYTGVFYANAEYGVSFALGYVGDFYIDYGPIFMFFAIFIFGLLIGGVIVSIYNTSLNTFWCMAIMMPLFILLYKFENSLIKFFGNLIMFWIVATLFNKYVSARIDKYLKK